MPKAFLLKELFFYLIIQIFGLFSAWKVLQLPMVKEELEKQRMDWLSLILSILIGTILILLAIRFLKYRPFYKVFFGFFFFLSTFYTLNLWLPLFFSLVLTLILFWLHYRWPRVITHNLIISLTVVWISILLGLAILPWQMVIALLILSVYDMIAVWKTKHMIKMFKGLAERGVIFALIIPEKIKNLFRPIPILPIGREVKIDELKRESVNQGDLKASLSRRGFLLMGTGDIALPLAFAISTFYNSSKLIFLSPILIIIGTLLGILFINLVMIGKERKPIPALPPLVLGAICGWLISKILIYKISL